MRSQLFRTAAGAYVVDVVVHLVAQFSGADDLARWTQWVAIPLLAFAVLAARPPMTRLITLTLVALFFSWLGDFLPHFFDDDTSFLVLVGCFMLAQIAYIAAFLPHWRESYLRSLLVLPYVVLIGLLIYLCAPKAGSLLVPVLLYGLALGSMAVLASGVHLLAAAGGALFLLSDGLIAIGAFRPDIDIPASGFWVMSTYLIGQGLIAMGVLRRANPR